MNIYTKLSMIAIVVCLAFHTPALAQDATAYEMMEVVFVGKPKQSTIQPLMEAVLRKYNVPNTEEYRQKTASALVSMRKRSVVGVTEMQILKHVYQHGAKGGSLPDALGMSAYLLEEGLR